MASVLMESSACEFSGQKLVSFLADRPPVRLRQCFLLSEKPYRVLDKHRAGDDPPP